MTSQRRRVAALAVVCIAVVSASLLGSFVVVARPLSAPVAATPTPTPAPTHGSDACGAVQVPHFYAFDLPKESPKAFGPPASGQSAQALNAELITRLCGDFSRNLGGDPRLLFALRSVAFGDDPNRTYTPEEWQLGLADLMQRVEWHGASAVNQPALQSAYTLMMAPDGSQPVVELTRISEPPSQYLMLPVLRNDGTTVHLMLRAACGFQPVIAYNLPLPPSWRQLR